MCSRPHHRRGLQKLTQSVHHKVKRVGEKGPKKDKRFSPAVSVYEPTGEPGSCANGTAVVHKYGTCLKRQRNPPCNHWKLGGKKGGKHAAFRDHSNAAPWFPLFAHTHGDSVGANQHPLHACLLNGSARSLPIICTASAMKYHI